MKKNNDESKFKDLFKPLSGSILIDKMTKDFDLFSNLKTIFLSMPPIFYNSYTELDALSREMVNQNYPTGSFWGRIQNFASFKPPTGI